MSSRAIPGKVETARRYTEPLMMSLTDPTQLALMLVSLAPAVAANAEIFNERLQ